MKLLPQCSAAPGAGAAHICFGGRHNCFSGIDEVRGTLSNVSELQSLLDLLHSRNWDRLICLADILTLIMLSLLPDFKLAVAQLGPDLKLAFF